MWHQVAQEIKEFRQAHVKEMNELNHTMERRLENDKEALREMKKQTKVYEDILAVLKVLASTVPEKPGVAVKLVITAGPTVQQ